MKSAVLSLLGNRTFLAYYFIPELQIQLIEMPVRRRRIVCAEANEQRTQLIPREADKLFAADFAQALAARLSLAALVFTPDSAI